MALPFWISIGVLSVVQGAVVATTVLGADSRLVAGLRGLRQVRSPWWGLLPGLSVALFVVVVSLAAGSAEVLTYLALVAVPVLAAVALAFLLGRPRPARALIAVALFALAWADRGALPGEAAAVALSALSCVTLGALLASVTPRWALAVGIVVMAMVDTALVIADLLQRPNNALNAVHPAAGLPRLQAETFGSAVMGYGDLFVAGAFGGLLAIWASRRAGIAGAALTASLALAFDLMFFVVPELPATVPVALALLVLATFGRGRARRTGAHRAGVGTAVARRSWIPGTARRRLPARGSGGPG